MQRLRAKLLRNHFIPIAKMPFILQWENASMLGTRMTSQMLNGTLKMMNHSGTFIPDGLRSPSNFGHLPSHSMHKTIVFPVFIEDIHNVLWLIY